MAETRPYTRAELEDPAFFPAFFARKTTRKAREMVLRRLIATALRNVTCDREHVPYRSSSRSDNRFFGDENNG